MFQLTMSLYSEYIAIIKKEYVELK